MNPGLQVVRTNGAALVAFAALHSFVEQLLNLGIHGVGQTTIRAKAFTLHVVLDAACDGDRCGTLLGCLLLLFSLHNYFIKAKKLIDYCSLELLVAVVDQSLFLFKQLDLTFKMSIAFL